MTKPAAQYKADLDLWTNRHNGVRKDPRRTITLHTDESAYNYSTGTVRTTGWTAKRLAEYNREAGVRGSYHLGVDNARQVVRQVNDRGGTWSVGSRGNNESIHICMAGTTAYWTRAQWLSKPDLLDQTAIVVAHEALFHGIPIRKIGPSEVAANKWGIVHHDDWSKGVGGSDHWDAGPNFPWDHFIKLVQKHSDHMMGKTDIEHVPDAPALPTPKEGETMSAIDSRRIELMMDQLAGPGKKPSGEPDFTGWRHDDVVQAAHYNLDNDLGLTLVQQIALVLEAQEEQRKHIETMASAISALTGAVARLVDKENE